MSSHRILCRTRSREYLEHSCHRVPIDEADFGSRRHVDDVAFLDGMDSAIKSHCTSAAQDIEVFLSWVSVDGYSGTGLDRELADKCIFAEGQSLNLNFLV